MTPSALPAARAAEYLQFAHTLADAAAAVTLPLFRQPLQIEAKADASPFTMADCNSEKAMVALINDAHPTHGVIGEEYGSQRAEAEFVWVLDPIDGTRSFISGSPQYGTLIGLLHRGTPVVGVLDFPALRERWSGLCVAAQRAAHFGKAAPSAAPCTVAAAGVSLAQAVAATTTAALLPDSAEDAQMRKFIAACAHVRFGGDAYAYAGVAAGFAHLALDYLMQAYDYLPLMPVIYGAGGVMSDWQGAPLAPFALEAGDAAGGGGGKRTVLAAASAPLQREALAALQG